jgi:DNA-binding transcriptional LysR family regulator
MELRHPGYFVAVAEALHSIDARRLRVGIGYCSDQSDIAALLGTFNAQQRGIQVETKTLSVPAQLAALVDGQLDIAFVRPPVSDHSLMSEVVIREALVVALPPKHRLASRSRLPLSALGNELFILPPRDVVPVFHDAVLKGVVQRDLFRMRLMRPTTSTWCSAWSLRVRVSRSFLHQHARSSTTRSRTAPCIHRQRDWKRHWRGDATTSRRLWPSSSLPHVES